MAGDYIITGGRPLNGTVWVPAAKNSVLPLLARLGRAQTVLPGGCRIGARPIDLHLAGLVQMGACPQLEGERLLLTAPAGLHGADITLRFPSVGATETLLLAAVLLCAEGPGSIEDVIFERRFGCAAGFAALGGRVRVEGRTLYAEPGGTLQGTVLEAPDLRGGAALVIAALAAQGRSRITHTEFIDRGYADFAQKLTALGGQIARETPRGADCPKKRTSKT